MKTLCLAVALAMTATLAHAEDMAEMISQYRREHGLSTVKTDPELTAIAERQAMAMAASGVMDRVVRLPGGRRASAQSVGKHCGRHQDLDRDVSGVAELAGPQCEPAAIPGR